MIAPVYRALALLAISVPLSLHAQTQQSSGVPGWRCWGECTRDTTVKREGSASALIVTATADSVGSFRQGVHPEAYIGKRVRYSAWVKTDQVAGPTLLWMRVDGQGLMDALRFDNMSDRPIFSLTDWQRYEIVLDVPTGSTAIVFGMLVNGHGRAWIDDVRLEVVDASVPETRAGPPPPPPQDSHAHPEVTPEQITQMMRGRAAAPKQPVNLSFEQRP